MTFLRTLYLLALETWRAWRSIRAVRCTICDARWHEGETEDGPLLRCVVCGAAGEFVGR